MFVFLFPYYEPSEFRVSIGDGSSLRDQTDRPRETSDRSMTDFISLSSNPQQPPSKRIENLRALGSRSCIAQALRIRSSSHRGHRAVALTMGTSPALTVAAGSPLAHVFRCSLDSLDSLLGSLFLLLPKGLRLLQSIARRIRVTNLPVKQENLVVQRSIVVIG